MSGLEPPAPVTPPGPAQIVWVSSMIRIVPVSAGQLADGVEVAGLGQDDPDVGQGRLDEERRDVPVGEGALERRRRR